MELALLSRAGRTEERAERPLHSVSLLAPRDGMPQLDMERMIRTLTMSTYLMNVAQTLHPPGHYCIPSLHHHLEQQQGVATEPYNTSQSLSQTKVECHSSTSSAASLADYDGLAGGCPWYSMPKIRNLKCTIVQYSRPQPHNHSYSISYIPT